MKTKLRSAALIASAALTLAPAAHASLLVGWHDFDQNSTNETPDFAASGFSGFVKKALQSRTEGGDTGGGIGVFYGDSAFNSGSGSDGYLRTGANEFSTFFTLTNTSGSAVSLGTLFFDAAAGYSNSILDVAYRYSNSTSYLSPSWTAIGSTLGSLPVLNPNVATTSGDFADFALSLTVGASPLTLGNGQSIQFAFKGGSTYIDNIAITAITAIPEPAGLLALACLLGSGLMLRSRPRAFSAQATA